jgi:hypothetical protein
MTDRTLHGLQVSIQYADGRAERLVLDADTVLVGSGGHCDVRLPLEHAAVEHLALSAIGGVIYARARSLNPHPTIDGVDFVRTPVLPEAVLGVGPVRLRAAVVEISNEDHLIRRTRHSPSPLVYAVAMAGLPIGLAMSVAGTTSEPTALPPEAPPSLWPGPITQCPQNSPEAAVALAMEKMLVGNAKRERRPFHVQDGVAAVPLYETAAACFGTGGQAVAAAHARVAAVELRRQVSDDYAAHAVRLEHALEVDDTATARKEVSVLRGFTAGLQGPYVIWLSNEERRLSLQAAHPGGAS